MSRQVINDTHIVVALQHTDIRRRELNPTMEDDIVPLLRIQIRWFDGKRTIPNTLERHPHLLVCRVREMYLLQLLQPRYLYRGVIQMYRCVRFKITPHRHSPTVRKRVGKDEVEGGIYRK